MTYLIEFPLEDGDLIVAEVGETELEEGIVRAARPGEVATKASQTFEAALESIKPTAETIITKLHSLSDPPNEVADEFGLKLNAKVGMVIASGDLEAHYKVTVTWKQD